MKRGLLPSINFKAYRRPTYLRAVYAEFGRGAMVYHSRYRREACPLCQPEDSVSRCFSWSFEKCSFYCHKCKAMGDALELARRLLACKVVEAAKWLEERGGPSGSGVLLAGDGRCAATRAST